jgi:hypothetical protein
VALAADVSDDWVFAALLALLLLFGTLVAWRHCANAALERLAQVLVWSGVLQAVLGAVLFSFKAEYRIFFSAVSRSRMGNAAFFSATLVTGLAGMVLMRRTAPHAHNDFVEIATDYGLVGLAMLGLLVAMSVVALLVHRTVDFSLQIPANALTMTVILAMGWVTYRLPSPGSQLRPMPTSRLNSASEMT